MQYIVIMVSPPSTPTSSPHLLSHLDLSPFYLSLVNRHLQDDNETKEIKTNHNMTDKKKSSQKNTRNI